MTGPEQRRHPRVKPPNSIVIGWQSGTQRGVSYADNMSVSGAFIRTKVTVPERSLVQVLLDMPVGQVRGRALVRRVAENSGMAVEIIAMDQEDRGRLLRQMRDLLQP
jgi:hypothetical protein